MRILASLTDELASADRRSSAVAFAIASHTCGPQGVAVVSQLQTAVDPVTAQQATQALDDRRNAQIQALAADTWEQRWNAAESLQALWPNDPTLIDDLIAFARQRADNGTAVYNVVVVLLDLPATTLRMREAELKAFFPEARANGPRTSEKVDLVMALMRSSSPSAGH